MTALLVTALILVGVVALLFSVTAGWLLWRTHRLQRRGQQPTPPIATPIPPEDQNP